MPSHPLLFHISGYAPLAETNTEESLKGINAIIDIMKTAAQSIANIDYYECLMFYSSQSVIS